jgi:hypothetical protein
VHHELLNGEKRLVAHVWVGVGQVLHHMMLPAQLLNDTGKRHQGDILISQNHNDPCHLLTIDYGCDHVKTEKMMAS